MMLTVSDVCDNAAQSRRLPAYAEDPHAREPAGQGHDQVQRGAEYSEDV